MQTEGPILFQCSDPFEVQSWSCLSAGWSCPLFDTLCAMPQLLCRLYLLCQCWLGLCLHVHWTEHRLGGLAIWFAMLHVLLGCLQGLTINKAEAGCWRQLDSSFGSGLNTTYCVFKTSAMHKSHASLCSRSHMTPLQQGPSSLGVIWACLQLITSTGSTFILLQ